VGKTAVLWKQTVNPKGVSDANLLLNASRFMYYG
jgi:hypothetical protein